jgi:hypothetical protein
MDSIHATIADASLDTGSNTLEGTAVAAGKMQKITNITYAYTGTVTNVRIEIKAGGKTILKTDANPTSGQVEEWNGQAYLEATEKISIVITNATATDAFTADVNGVEMQA